MANGFFLGGVAEGMADNEKRALERDRLTTEAGLRTRGLDITEAGQKASIGINERAQALAEKNAARVASMQGVAVVDKRIAETMAVVSETVKAATAAGRDPAAIQKAVAPLLDSAKRLAVKAGRDPAAFDAQVGAMLTGPSLVEAAGAKGTAEGVAKAATMRALAAAGVVDENAGFKDKGQRVTAENVLRDDYMKQSQPFVTARDFYQSFKTADPTGAGDITRVFAFMKMLEPTSAVMPGEAANVNNAAGVPSWLMGQYNRLRGGGTLSDTARAELKGQVEKLYARRGEQHDKLTTQFADVAKRYKMDVNNVVMDLSPAPNKGGGDPGAIPAPPPGFVLSK